MKKLVLVFALMAFSLVSFAQLRYNLEIGEKYGLKQLTIQDITQTVQGMTQNIKNTIGGDLLFTIKSKDGNVYTSDFVFASLIFKMESPMFSMGYDSNDSNQEENEMTKLFKSIVGYSFTMKFNDKGEILEVDGFEKLMEKVKAESGGQASGPIQESLKSQFSDESMKQSLASMLIVYPDGKPKTGLSWNTTIEQSGAMPLISKYNYKISSANSSVVEMEGAGTMATKEGFSQERMGMTQHFDLKGDVTMNAKINAKTGWPITIKQTQDLSGNVSIESAQLPAPMEMPMSIKGESTFSEF
ncbi:DUF6263 family protein [Carboxylicivirga linearis]|uniref:DUF4412 domain-containing protein n=1 Tax=Carboxylicivirga linearis TaxID=1628157 RepID=A0ABS5JTE1_9BACT|nr:DUF6263 family protein [Carboxylicivirga linearis]MBS2097711.1 hypothetical protein [Carboxylicivirga linearis]